VALVEDAEGTRILVSERIDPFGESATVVYRVDPTGQLLSSLQPSWGAGPGDAAQVRAAAALGTSPQDLLLVGSIASGAWASRITADGDLLWDDAWPCGTACWFSDVASPSAVEFVVAGAVANPRSVDPFVGVLQFDGRLSSNAWPGDPSVEDSVFSFAIAGDGDIVVLGTTRVGEFEWEAWIHKASPAGEIQWQAELPPRDPRGTVMPRGVAVGGPCDAVWVVGRESPAGLGFLALLAP
jgi:hypothetical protein